MTHDHDGQPAFSANKIFVILFFLTLLEVGWSVWLFPHGPQFVKWGGLIVFAFWKGLLIYTYFMHMKFEGWIVKALLAPTPILIFVIVSSLIPDVSKNDKLIYPVGSQVDKTGQHPGRVVGMIEPPKSEHGEHGKPEEKKE